MEIASKILDQKDGLDRKRIIDKKILINLEIKSITVEGTDYTYSPTGVIISSVPFRYEVDNIPEIKAVESVDAILDEEGNVSTPAIIGSPFVPANNRFDRIAESAIGLGISGMVQATINSLL